MGKKRLKMEVSQDDEKAKLMELKCASFTKRNAITYNKIASLVTSCIYQRKGMQNWERMKKLKKDHKKMKDSFNKWKTCKFYKQINIILEDRPFTNQP